MTHSSDIWRRCPVASTRHRGGRSAGHLVWCHLVPTRRPTDPDAELLRFPGDTRTSHTRHTRHGGRAVNATWLQIETPDTWAEKFESFERINSIRETNGNFGSCNSCKRLGTSRLHELHEPKFPFVSRIEFIRSKLSNFSAYVSGAIDTTWCSLSAYPCPMVGDGNTNMAQVVTRRSGSQCWWSK